VPLERADNDAQDRERGVVLALSSMRRGLEREADWRRRIHAASLVTGNAASRAARAVDRHVGVEHSFWEVVSRTCRYNGKSRRPSSTSVPRVVGRRQKFRGSSDPSRADRRFTSAPEAPNAASV